MAFVNTAYLGLATAINATTGALTEQAGNAYARQATSLLYDPVANLIQITEGATFGVSGSGSWTASTYAFVADASSGGNILFAWPITSTVVGTTATLTIPGQIAVYVLPAGLTTLSTAANTIFGYINPGQPGQVAVQTAAAALRYTAADLTVSGSSALAAYSAVVSLTYGTAISTNAALGSNFLTTLTGNTTLSNPTNLTPGQTLSWRVVQDGTGSRTVTLGSAFKTAGGTPTFTTTASATDVWSGVTDGTSIFGRLDKALA